MPNVTLLLESAATGDPQAAADLLPLVYDELRKLASVRLVAEKPGQTLQATALVHEAYVRLVGGEPDRAWNSRGHFFAAAAEAMRRILIENARSKARGKRGGDWQRVNFEHLEVATALSPEQLLELDETISGLTAHDHLGGELVKLRYFTGLSLDEAAAMLGIATATAYRHWAYARAWLRSGLLEEK